VLHTHRFAWADIAAFLTGPGAHWFDYECLQLRLADGKTVRSLALALSPIGHSPQEVVETLRELRRRQSLALDSPAYDLAERERSEALAAVGDGDLEPAFKLLVDDRLSHLEFRLRLLEVEKRHA